ncbi:hypothetical protein [Bacillus gaemokensis]|uniref:Uncharacterized protein n=1 Tax=Bacillus gaemokensis TaxID=574375 RepID=A0A073KBN0_9BACI|nr:hypothetical protein [Bacillus gaemokensis]KEK23911.1 hypothetical protein BAGA_05640 [Bacillus gaemokensis]KYG38034.1 hypothetical protein AZF08_19925 [Bacillus gaemokensis]
MTTKTITLSEKRFEEIKKGTVLKFENDLFIVAEIEGAKNVDPVNDALFSPSSIRSTPYFRQERVEAKYNLVSFMSGSRFYGENTSLQELIRKITNRTRKFQVVDKIEFIEG